MGGELAQLEFATVVAALALSGCGAASHREPPARLAPAVLAAPRQPEPAEPRLFEEPEPSPPAESAVVAPPAPVAPPPEPAVRYPFHEPMPARETGPADPALRNATLSPAACRAELARRKLPVKRVGGDTRGIATPVRMPAELLGVRWIVPPKNSKFGLLDCRLALALSDFAPVLQRHEVTAIRVDNFYRPRAKLSKRVKSQHSYGLAMDIVSFTLKDGRSLVVERDWQADIGDAVCGPDAVMWDATDEAVRLRNLVCDVAREKLFHHMLTPSYDAAHRDHMHWDIKRKGYAVIVR